MVRNLTKKHMLNPKPKDNDVKYYKCGRFGHYEDKCKMQEKINQLENLDISEELKESLITIKNILLNFEEEDSSSSYEEFPYKEFVKLIILRSHIMILMNV